MKFTAQTTGILLVCVLVIVVAALAVNIFKKQSMPTPTGDLTLKSSIFGLTINKGGLPKVTVDNVNEDINEG